MTLKVKITAKNGAELPRYQTTGSAGMDLKAYINDPVTLLPGARALIPTGLFIELPNGYEAQVRARSGLAMRHGIGMPNGIGTIDSDYRGEILVALINLGEQAFIIENGDRIAQLIIARYEKVEWIQADALTETERGAGGFGHTGD